MTINELKSRGIQNLIEASEYINRSHQLGIFLVPDIISDIVACIINPENSTNAIVLNSNFGEISSKLKDIKNLVNVEINSNNVEVAKYLNPNLKFINEDPLSYSSDKFDNVVSFLPFGLRDCFEFFI